MQLRACCTSKLILRRKIYTGTFSHATTASSAHLFAIAYALSHLRERRLAVLAGLGIEQMEFPNPARPGDLLSFSMTILDKRESKSRPDRGIVRVHTVVSNQHGEPVVDYKLKVMVARRGV